MAVKPILFKPELVWAILSDAKTETRRVIKPQPESEDEVRKLTPRYMPGDILWVRETWAEYSVEATQADGNPGVADWYLYKADYAEGARELVDPEDRIKWKPSIHMPKKACRLWLEVTGAYAHRIRAMSGKDAVAEGCGQDYALYELLHHGGYKKARIEFIRLWDTINARRGYPFDSNPWVWAYTFKKTEAPENWAALSGL